MTNEFENVKLPTGCEILACLKDGKREKTFLIYDADNKRKAVLKLFVYEARSLETEADIISYAAGEGVPKLYGLYNIEGQRGLIREYIEGETLLDYYQKRGRLPCSEVLDIAVKLCGILERLHLHNPPIIHRDIKAENIIRTPEGEIYLIDFGISRAFDEAAERDTCIMGTPAYASPEQFGFRQTDERSDIYSFGCLLHELSTGERDLSEGNPEKPSALEGIIKKCTRFSPEDRFRNVIKLKRKLLSAAKANKRSIEAVFLFRSPFFLISGAILAFAVTLAAVYKTEFGRTAEIPSGAAYAFSLGTDPNRIFGRILFKDPFIETAVRNMLNKPYGEITESELKSVTELYLIGSEAGENWEGITAYGTTLMYKGTEIKSRGNAVFLDDIALMPNLRTLVMCNQNISDLSPLSGSKIERLALHGNSVSDVAPLGNCKELGELIISDNPVKDFSPLSHCEKLWRLTAGATALENLDGIAEIKNLNYLDLHNCSNLSDCSALREMRQLGSLMIKPASKETIDTISKMGQLEYLYIWDAPDLTDLSRLSDLSKLKILLTDLCPITSLEGLDAFPELIFLSVQNTLVESLTPLKDCGKLEELSVCGIPADNWEALSELGKLANIYCDENQVEGIRGALKGNENVNVIVNIV